MTTAAHKQNLCNGQSAAAQRVSCAIRFVTMLGLLTCLSGCDGGSNFTGTDKIDFANRAINEPLPTAVVAAAGGPPTSTLTEEGGVLVDGRLAPSGPHVNDAGFATQEARLAIPNRTSSFFDIFYPDRRHEVIAFTRDRRPEILYTPWHAGENIFRVEFKVRRDIPLTIWIVAGPAPTPFETQRVQALEAVLRTVAIWRAERAGLGFSDVRILNATADPQAAARGVVPTGPTEVNTWKPLREEIGFEAGRLNVYWVSTVESSASRGFSNFGAQIVMGASTGDELLSHEIGHALSLTHVDGRATFDQSNVMHSASSTRQFMTEGQIVRAHMNSASILWNLFLDVGQHPPGRDCGPDDFSGLCPALNRRLWADGSEPANN